MLLIRILTGVIVIKVAALHVKISAGSLWLMEIEAKSCRLLTTVQALSLIHI